MGNVLSRRGRVAGALLGSAGLGASLLACAAILDLEDDKPLRVAPDTSALVDAGDATDAKDAAPPAPCDETKGCSAACPHDFCDDFDMDGQAPETRWIAPSGFTNPILKGDAGFALADTAGLAYSPPRALLATTGSAGTSFSMLVNKLSFADRHPGQVFDGVHAAIELRVEALNLLGPGGPVPDAGSAAMLGLLRPDSFPPKGVAIVITDDAIQLDVSDDILTGSGTQTLAKLSSNFKAPKLLGIYVLLELFVGDQARAVKEGYDTCQGVTPGLVAAAKLGKILGQACLPVTGAFGPATWAENPAMLIGSLLFGPGNAVVRVDNAVADFYVK